MGRPDRGPREVTAKRPTSRGQRHVSVKDVAARAGVSFQTTSKVLNGGGSVSEETRTRIVRVAEELGYVPNLQARSLVMRRTLTVGLITGDFSDPGLSRILAGAEQEARRQSYGVMITSIEPEGAGTEYALPAMMERRVDGILLAAPQMEGDRALSHVLDHTLPIVSIHHIAGGAIAAVGPDDELAGYFATRHLVELGHRVIGAVTGVRGRRMTQSRQRGFRRALDEAGIESADELVEEGGERVADGSAAAARLLAARPDITAIFCHHDLEALGVLRAVHDAGRQVPEKCSLVSCDDLDMAAYTTPPLTTVHVPFYETGAEAMRELLREVADTRAKPVSVRLPVHLVTRSSTAPAS